MLNTCVKKISFMVAEIWSWIGFISASTNRFFFMILITEAAERLLASFDACKRKAIWNSEDPMKTDPSYCDAFKIQSQQWVWRILEFWSL